MKEIEIVPFEGIGKLKPGMNQNDLRQAIDSPAKNISSHTIAGIDFPESDYFLKSTIQVTYGCPRSEIEV